MSDPIMFKLQTHRVASLLSLPIWPFGYLSTKRKINIRD